MCLWESLSVIASLVLSLEPSVTEYKGPPICSLHFLIHSLFLEQYSWNSNLMISLFCSKTSPLNKKMRWKIPLVTLGHPKMRLWITWMYSLLPLLKLFLPPATSLTLQPLMSHPLRPTQPGRVQSPAGNLPRGPQSQGAPSGSQSTYVLSSNLDYTAQIQLVIQSNRQWACLMHLCPKAQYFGQEVAP